MKTLDGLQLYPLVRVALALIIGLVIGYSIGAVVSAWGWILATFVVLIATVACRRWQTVQSCLLLITVIFFGISCLSIQQNKLNISIPQEKQLSEAVVASPPKIKGKTVQCDLYILGGRMAGQKVKASFLRDSISRRCDDLQLGDGIVIRSAFDRVTNFYPESHFDYQRWMAIHGYVAQTFIFYRDWQLRQFDLTSMPRAERLKLVAQKVRLRLLGHYQTSGLDEQNYAIVAAMTLGDKSMLSKETKDMYSVSGASHVLALSGLHLSIIFGLLTLVFGGRKKQRVTSLLLTILTVWFYVFLTGMSSSVMRSAIMLTVYAFTSLLNRNKMSLNTLALTAIIMLVFNPLSLWDVGFQLSFMAVLAILLLYQPIESWIPRRLLNKSVLCTKIWGTMAVSIAAQMGTAPLVAYYFGRFSTYFLLTNLIAIPLTIVILYVACLLFILLPFPLLQGWVAKALVTISHLLNTFLSIIASWPGASIENIDINRWQLLLIYVLFSSCCGVVYYLQRGHRRSLIY